MKKIIVAIAFAGYATLASAAVLGSSHDFTGGFKTATTTENQTCKFCHAPHGTNAAYAGAALWNQGTDNTATAYTTYSTAGVPAGDVVLSANTRACLSCHDGSASVGQVWNNGTPISLFDIAAQQITGLANLGTTIANDHPVDMVYTVVAGVLAPIQAGTPNSIAGTLPLGASDRVMCTTCHDPHATTAFTYMLRADPAGSVICTTCHINK